MQVDVAQRFSGYPVQGLRQWIGQFIGQGGQVAMDDDGRFGGQIRKDRSQPVADELGGINVHQGGPQGGDARSYRGRGVFEDSGGDFRHTPVTSRPGEGERDAGEILYHPVVKISGDTPALHFRCRQAPVQQRFALLLSLPEAAGQRPRHRYLQHLEQGQGPERHRCDASPDPGSRRRDGFVTVVRLEEKRGAPRRLDGQIHLEELPKLTFVLVLWFGEVAHIGLDETVTQGVDLIVGENEGLAFEIMLVGVDNRSRRVPDLHPHEGGTQDPTFDDRGDLRDPRRSYR